MEGKSEVTHSIHKRKFIRRRGIVNLKLFAFGFLVVRNDSVADAEALDESIHVVMIGMLRVVQMFPYLRVFKVNVSNSGSIGIRLGVRLTVGDPTSSEFLEFHDVLGESTGLIGEDVGNHTELFIQVTWVDFGMHVFLHIEQHPVTLNKVSLE